MAQAQSEEYPRLGRYQVINKIAAGGMAEVFLARATGAMGFQRHVALKLIHSNFTRDDEFVKMFIDEARIAMHLHHRNIVQVFDLDQVGDTYFIAMEFVHGINLYDLYERIASKNRWIEPPMALYLVAEVSKGLHFAHTRTGPDGRPLGIVHRDISPQNVMLSFEGEVKITDFGIATAAERLHQTAAGIVKGKYAYMAPERLQEQPIDARVDVFAIGVLLYELLVGENPFAGPSAVETIENVLNKRIPPPSERGAPVSKRLDEICLKALARDPRQRYASGQALADAVTDYAMELTHARKDMAAGDSALAALLAELFPEKKTPLRAGDPSSIDLPGVESVRVSDVRTGQGDFMETQEDLPAEVVSAALQDDDDDGYASGDDMDAPTILRMQAPRDLDMPMPKVGKAGKAPPKPAKPKSKGGKPQIVADSSGVTTLPPDAEPDDFASADHTVPTELPSASYPDATVRNEDPDDDEAFARTIQSSSGIDTLPEDMGEPVVVSVNEYTHGTSSPAPLPMRSEQLVLPAVSSQDLASPVRPRSSLNVIAGTLLAVAILVVGAALFVVSGHETALVQIESKPPGAEVLINGVKHDRVTPFTLPLELEQEVTVEVKLGGFKPAQRRIRPNSAMTLDVLLEEITGTIIIHRTPLDAEVIVNGVLLSGEEIRLANQKLGVPINIIIQAEKHLPLQKQITLDLENLTKDLELNLAPTRDKVTLIEPSKRAVSVETGDTPVRVFRRGQQVCKETPCLTELPIGTFTLQLQRFNDRGGLIPDVKTVPVEVKPGGFSDRPFKLVLEP